MSPPLPLFNLGHGGNLWDHGRTYKCCVNRLKWLKVAQLSLKLSELKNRSEPTELPAPDLNKLVSEGTISLFARQVENEGPDFLKI